MIGYSNNRNLLGAVEVRFKGAGSINGGLKFPFDGSILQLGRFQLVVIDGKFKRVVVNTRVKDLVALDLSGRGDWAVALVKASRLNALQRQALHLLGCQVIAMRRKRARRAGSGQVRRAAVRRCVLEFVGALVAIVGFPAVIHGIEKCEDLSAQTLLLVDVLLQRRDALGPFCAGATEKLKLNGLDLDVLRNAQLKSASKQSGAALGVAMAVAIVVEAREENVLFGEEN